MDESQHKTFFADLVTRFHGRVYRVAYRIVGSDADAADVTQEVFLRVLSRELGGAGFREPEARLTWLASRLALNHLRGERRRQRRQEVYAMSRRNDYQDLHVEQVEDLRVLRSELYRLPEPQRLSVVLCCQEGLTLHSVAGLMACAESTIHDRIKDGLAKLKARLQRRGFAVSAAALPKLMSGFEAAPVPSGLEGQILGLWGTHAGWIAGLTKLKVWSLPLALVAVALVSSIPLWNNADSTSLVFEIETTERLGSGSALVARVASQPELDFRIPIVNPAAAASGRLVPQPQSQGMKVGIRVVDGSGEAVQGAGVEVLADYRSVVTAWTDKEGRAKLAIPAGIRVQWILGLKSGVGFDYYEHYKDNRLALEPTAKLASEIKLVLDGSKKIRVHAEDEKGAALTGIRFVPWIFSKPKHRDYINLSGSKLAVRTSDGKGDAVFDWIPKVILEKVDPPTGFCLQSDTWFWPNQNRLVLFSQKDSILQARLHRKLRVKGRVTDPKGKAVARILVVAEGRGKPGTDYCRAEVKSHANGDFALWLAPGQRYTLCVVDSQWAAKALHFELGKAGLAQTLQLALCRGTRVHGQILDKKTSKPIPGVQVSLILKSPFVPARNTNKVHTYPDGAFVNGNRSDQKGRFEFRVADGDYYLAASTVRGRGSFHQPLGLRIRGQLESRQDLFDGVAMDPIAPLQVLPGSTKSYEFWLLKIQESLPKSRGAVMCGQCHAPRRY